MIIWIDGVNGVGKSHVASKLAEKLVNYNAEYVESDVYWLKLIQSNFFVAFSGFRPSCNSYFLKKLRNIIEEINGYGNMPIVSILLVEKLCEEELIGYFKEKNIFMLHIIILEAKAETIISRIAADPIRDNEAQEQQKSNVLWQKKYLKSSYQDAIRISTDDITIEVVEEIIRVIQKRKILEI